MFDLDYFLDRPRVLNVLQRKRLDRGLSQGELADAVGVSRRTIGSIELRQSVPSVRVALAIAGVLGASVEALFADNKPSADDGR